MIRRFIPSAPPARPQGMWWCYVIAMLWTPVYFVTLLPTVVKLVERMERDNRPDFAAIDPTTTGFFLRFLLGIAAWAIPILGLGIVAAYLKREERFIYRRQRRLYR